MNTMVIKKIEIINSIRDKNVFIIYINLELLVYHIKEIYDKIYNLN
jgi:hypothetical protein